MPSWRTGRSAGWTRMETRSRRRRCPPPAARGSWPATGPQALRRSCARLASWARITEPTRTPFSWARVNDASTSPGSDWRGIRPDSSITIRGRSRGGTSLISRLLASIGLRQDAQRAAPNAAGTGVTDLTFGTRASCGSGWPLYAMASYPCRAVNPGKAAAVRCAAAAAARTNPPATATSTLSASHDFQCCRSRPRSTIVTARTAVSPLPPSQHHASPRRMTR